MKSYYVKSNRTAGKPKCNPALPQAFGRRLAQFRHRLGLSQGDLAKSIGATVETICRYETGKRMPTYEGLATLVTILNVSYDDLLADTHDE